MAIGLAAWMALTATACAAETEDDETSVEATADELQSAPLADKDMRPIATPAGMPKPWNQPDSTGWFDEKGRCGPTALANLLRLYWIDLSPEKAYESGVRWVIGTMGKQIIDYLDEHEPELGCTLEHPKDGAAFLRSEIAGGHPVLVWYNTQGQLSSHWVTAVGTRGKGVAEEVIVMSWGRYYSIPMTKLVAAWRNVYGIRNPSIVCDDRTVLMSR
ncbi:MAG: hypothetical protein K0S65_273 [Labilithrix sp.]|nr:hypothetical protein [Labilithrix sp.]